MRFSVLVAAAFAAGAIAVPAREPVLNKRHVVHEKRNRLPPRWEQGAKLDENAVIPFRIALTQSNLHLLDDYLMDVSHPTSSNFGKHWSAEEVATTFAPSSDAVEAVKNWLMDSGVGRHKISLSQSRNWMLADITVKQAEELLQTSYYQFDHENGHATVACDEYSVPEDIREHIDFITPTVHFDVKVDKPVRKHKKRDTSAVGTQVQSDVGTNIGAPGSGSLPKYGGQTHQHHTGNAALALCNETIVPDCLRALYQIPTNPKANSKNSYGIVEYTPQAYLPSDLDLFFGNFSPALVGQTPKFDSIDGGVLQTEVESFSYNGESDLDLEYAMTLSYPQKVTLYQVGDLVEGASFNNFLDAIDASYCTYEGGDDPTQDGIYPDYNGTAPDAYRGPENCGGFASTYVISTSYSYNEADLTPFYEHRQCNEYAKLGLQGVTFLYSSGDYGVAGNSGQCIDPTTGEYNDGDDGLFNPSFPGTCPYITSVGATQVKNSTNLLANPSTTQPEIASESVIYSGGGFSNVFPAPSYQTAALAKYFKNYNPPYGADRYNNSQKTRGYPDISANGVNYLIAIDGVWGLVFGTSASSPTLGSLLTIINGERLDAGKGPIGFINPTIYAHPEVLTDIVEGGNQGCGTAGFDSVPGWDPVTGLGTPIFPKLSKLFLSLP